jgi:hypothetical protein
VAEHIGGMRTFYIDETGFTGEDLMSADQPVFAQATNDLSDGEAASLLESSFGQTRAQEFKYSRIRRTATGRRGAISLVQSLSSSPERSGTWIAHKEYAMITMIVEWWMEPLAYRTGLNLYENGANHATANMLFFTLGGFWPPSFRRELLLYFQRMFRARTAERFHECRKFVEKARRASSVEQDEVLRYLWPSFELLGLTHVHHLPQRVLDIALPGLVLIGHSWRARDAGPWELVHDNSTNMAKQRWLWDALSSIEVPEAHFEHPHTTATFPMNVISSRFADSAATPQLQVCDIIVGATAEFAKREPHSSEDNDYLKALEDAGIISLIRDSMWPSPDVTPEALGRKGWDGSKSIDWIADQMARRNVYPPRA